MNLASFLRRKDVMWFSTVSKLRDMAGKTLAISISAIEEGPTMFYASLESLIYVRKSLV